MTRDDIIRMVHDATHDPILGFGGGYEQRVEVFHFSRVQLERFAELVAVAEREACIKACAEVRVIVNGNHAWTGLHVQDQCMNAILARGSSVNSPQDW